MTVQLEEVARERLTLEEVADLWLDAFVAAGDGRDRRGRRDGAEERVAQPVLGDLRAQEVPALRIVGGHAPRVELQLATRGTRLGEGRVPAFLLGKIRRSGERMEVDVFRDALREHPRFRRVERQAHLEKDALQSHQPGAHPAPTEIRLSRGCARIQVEVY